ncbi:MAG: rRNA maturation RNase YbeY [Patescibacteria group bacterium]
MRKSEEQKRLELLACEVLGYLHKKDSYAEINLVKSLQMRKLNLRHLGKDKTTNVLSFSHPSWFPRVSSGSPRLLGEVYLDPVFIKKRGESIDYLLVHGLLHLLGLDHGRYDDRIKMERMEKKILKWLKIGS